MLSLREHVESHRQGVKLEDSQDEEEDPPDLDDLDETVDDLRQSLRNQARTIQDLLVDNRMLNREKLAVEAERDLLKLIEPTPTVSDLESDTLTSQVQESNEADISDIKTDSREDDVSTVRPSTATTGVELGRRLGRHQSQISRWKANPEELERRTRELDPDAIAWRYDSEAKLYYPIEK